MSAGQEEYPRASLDEEARGANDESAPLLHDANDVHRDANGHQSNWIQASSEWLHNTSQYLKQTFARSSTDRGKQRASENDGTAGMTATQVRHEQQHQSSSRFGRFRSAHPRAFLALIVLAALMSVVVLLIVIVLVHLFQFTLRSPDDNTQRLILARGFNVDGPDNVEILRFADDGIEVKIDARLGLDPDAALDAWLGKKNEMTWWSRKDRGLVEWAMSKVAGVQVDIDQVALRSPDWSIERSIDRINLIPDEGEHVIESMKSQKHRPAPLPPANLVTFDIDPILVPLPLSRGKSHSDSNNEAPEANTPISIIVTVTPSGPDILSFAEYTLQNKTAFVDLQVQSARIRGMSAKEWLKGALSGPSWFSGVPGWVNVQVDEVWKRLAQKLPSMEGNGTSTDDFLNLTRYDFQEIGGPDSPYPERALGLDAYAEAKNPLGKLLKGHVAYSLPFGAYLSVNKTVNGTAKGSEQPMVLLAAVATEPLDVHGEDKVPLKLHGRVVPPPQQSDLQRRAQSALLTKPATDNADADAAAEALNDFLSKFLRGDPNTLIVRGGSPFAHPKVQAGQLPMPGGGSDDLPVWLDRLLRSVSLPISFPGSKVTDLIQNVTISNLTITPHPFGDDKFVCSGVIMGVMNMPGQLATVDVQITDLWPDVLIFNGKPPSMKDGGGGDGDGDDDDKALQRKSNAKKGGNDDPVPDPLPDPLPDHAFGRVVPHTWAKAETYIDPEDPKGKRKLLRSELKNVPFTILPGRSGEFRSFSWKIVTGEGARAGIEGSARAKIWNSGLGKLQLTGMPVKGVFTVGKRSGNGGGDDGDGDGDDGLQ